MMASRPTNEEIVKELRALATKVGKLEDRVDRVKESAGAAQKEANAAKEAADKARDAAGTAKKEAADATKAARAASQAAAEAKATSNTAAEASAKATTSAELATKVSTEARTSADQAKKVASDANAKASDAQTRIGNLQKTLGPGKSVPLPSGPGAYSYLNVPVPDMDFDDVVGGALNDLRTQYKPADPKKLVSKIVASSLGSWVERVTQHLGRAGITDTRRHVLAAVYPHLLESKINSVADPKTLSDAPGFARNLLIELETDYLDDFADLVVAKTQTELSIKLNDIEKKRLKQRVLESV